MFVLLHLVMARAKLVLLLLHAHFVLLDSSWIQSLMPVSLPVLLAPMDKPLLALVMVFSNFTIRLSYLLSNLYRLT